MPTDRFTLRGVAASLAGVSLLQTVTALKLEGDASRSNAIGATVCLVAYLHYTWMRESTGKVASLQLRYSDWVVTCPLLLWELSLQCGVGGEPLAKCVALVLLMLGLGYVSARSDGWRRNGSFLLSCVAFVLAVHLFLSSATKHAALARAFFAVWGMYPIAFLFGNESAFDTLDLVSKAGFGMYVSTKG